MKIFSLFLMAFIVCQTNLAYSQSTLQPQSKVEEFIFNLFDKDKRAERKKIRITKRAERKAKRLAKEQATAPKAPAVIKPVVKTAAKPEKSKSCSIYDSMIPYCYNKRNDNVLKIALLYYGDHMKASDLDRIEPILIDRFSKSTNGLVEIEVISKKVMPFRTKMPEDFTYNGITDKKRLQRIWYYDNVGARIMQEVYEEYKKVESKELMDKLDAVVAITGGQFDGLGFASGRVSVTEYPREIAWAAEDGGRVEYVSDFQIVDELLHELGHNMFLDHTSNQCQKSGLSFKEQQECCEMSDSKNDVMSYCRKRANVDENFMHGFESCNLDMIENKVIPAMLSGGQWNIAGRTSCK